MKISVCMATYNGEKYIRQQLQSILQQLGADDEIIVSDDNSTDGTVAEIGRLSDRRIKVVYNKKKGLISNFENAIQNASGDYIFLSDQDDIWKPEKLQKTMECFDQGFDLVLSDSEAFNSSSSETIYPSFFEFNKSKKGILNNIMKNSYIGCCMAFNRKIKDKVLPFPSGLPMHDSWIGLNAEIFGKVKFLKEPLIRYRLHDANASFTGAGKSDFGIFKKISFRVSLIKNLSLKLLLS